MNFKDYDIYDQNEFDLSTFALESHEQTIRFLIANFKVRDLVYHIPKGYFWKIDDEPVKVKHFKQFQNAEKPF